MIGSGQEFDKLRPLLADLVDGRLTDDGIEQLQSLLNSSRTAREAYARHMMTHALLQWRPGHLMESGNRADSADLKIAKAISQLSVSIPIAPAAAPVVETNAAADLENHSKILQFVNRLGRAINGHPLRFAASLMLAAVVTAGAFYLTRSHNQQNLPAVAAQTQPPNQSVGAGAADSSAIAQFSGGVECEWNNRDHSPVVGDRFAIGQSFQLISGIAEINFDVGARVLVQSPATFSLESKKCIRMTAGKLTAEISTADARGFKVVTPEATFVDQGTEFGVEVAPGGSSKIHVFKGTVDVSLNPKDGTALPMQRLLANSGARLEGDLARVTFVEDTGEAFVRSLDQSDRDQHTVAYWRFEDHPVGTLVPNTRANQVGLRGTVDSSFNGNDLFTHTAGNQPGFSADVPAAIVPHSGKLNRGCLDNTEPPDRVRTRDVYTHSAFSHASPIDIQQFAPAQWTIEASVKVKQLERRQQTFVGRDAQRPGVKDQPPSRLAFQVNEEGQFAIRFIDADERVHEAVASQFEVEENKWYNVAAVSDGRALMFYADALDGRGYRLLAKTNMPDSGSTALGKGNDAAEWSIGRGKVDGNPAEWFRGWIDEVRVSDVALDPAEFLFASNRGRQVQDISSQENRK
jgi:hypothetical protein